MPEVYAYVSHCSWKALADSIRFETPLVCIPGYMEQLYNSDLVKNKKIGVQVYEPSQLGSSHQFSP